MSAFILKSRHVEATQMDSGDFMVRDSVLGDVLIKASKFALGFRRSVHDEKAEQAVQEILSASSLTQDLQTELLNSFRGSNPLEFAQTLRELNFEPDLSRALLKQKISMTGLSR